MTIPFQLLHTFVVVARCGRMSAAAKELSVTPGAISQRVKEVEAATGRSLFVRSPLGLTLTRAGQRLLDKVNTPFSAIETAYSTLSTQTRGHRIVITTTPAFALNWLVPRLASFKAVDPRAEIAVESDTRVVDLRDEPVDLAIRHGLGQYPGLESHWLTAPEQIVVASPALLSADHPIDVPEDCLRYPLLHDIEEKDWECWLRALGCKQAVPEGGQAYSDDNLLVRAAVAGQGLALVANTYANEEIAHGRLRQVLTTRWPTRFAYYLVGTRATFRRAAVQRFKSWLAQELAES